MELDFQLKQQMDQYVSRALELLWARVRVVSDEFFEKIYAQEGVDEGVYDETVNAYVLRAIGRFHKERSDVFGGGL